MALPGVRTALPLQPHLLSVVALLLASLVVHASARRSDASVAAPTATKNARRVGRHAACNGINSKCEGPLLSLCPDECKAFEKPQDLSLSPRTGSPSPRRSICQRVKEECSPQLEDVCPAECAQFTKPKTPLELPYKEPIPGQARCAMFNPETHRANICNSLKGSVLNEKQELLCQENPGRLPAEDRYIRRKAICAAIQQACDDVEELLCPLECARFEAPPMPCRFIAQARPKKGKHPMCARITAQCAPFMTILCEDECKAHEPNKEPVDQAAKNKLAPSQLKLFEGREPSVEPVDKAASGRRLNPTKLKPFEGREPSVEPVDKAASGRRLDPTKLKPFEGREPSVEPVDKGREPSVEPVDKGREPSVEPVDKAPKLERKTRIQIKPATESDTTPTASDITPTVAGVAGAELAVLQPEDRGRTAVEICGVPQVDAVLESDPNFVAYWVCNSRDGGGLHLCYYKKTAPGLQLCRTTYQSLLGYLLAEDGSFEIPLVNEYIISGDETMFSGSIVDGRLRDGRFSLQDPAFGKRDYKLVEPES